MRTVVLGAGIVGTAAIWDLQRRGHDVAAADVEPASVEAAARRFDVEGTVADVTDGDSLRSLFGDADAVVSAVPYRFGVDVASAAVDTGTHYFDFGGNPTVVAAQRNLDEAAKDAGVLVVPDCGLAPGIANVMATHLIRLHREGSPDTPIDSVQIRVGALPQTPVGMLGYQFAFNSAGLINEYAEPCEVLASGEYATVDPLTRFEKVDWDEIGPLEAFSTAGGTSSMCAVHRGKVADLEYKTLRFPGHGRIFAAMREIGLFDETAGPDGISRREKLLEALNTNLPRSDSDMVLVRTWLDAGGSRRSLEFVDKSTIDETANHFSALARTTAFPTTALADLVLHDQVPTRGVATMNEAAPPLALLGELESVGITAI